MTRQSLFRTAVVAVSVLVMAGCGSSASPRPDIAFVSSRDGDYAIFGMNADGGRQKRLTHERGNPATPKGLFFQVNPAWSTDGMRIAFASRRDGPSHIFVMGADGSGTQRLTSTTLEDGHPSWSPDRRSLVFQRGTPGGLFLMKADGADAHLLAQDDAEEGDPAWSPDGDWITYARRTPGTSIREIWLIHPDGSGRRQLTKLGASSRAPAWSPDGKRIAFSSDKRGDVTAVYVIGIDGQGFRRLAGVALTGSFEPSWSPDGKVIAFWSDGSIYSVTLDGSGLDQLTKDENDSSPAWRPVQPQTTG